MLVAPAQNCGGDHVAFHIDHRPRKIGGFGSFQQMKLEEIIGDIEASENLEQLKLEHISLGLNRGDSQCFVNQRVFPP